ncbi:MAG: serine/threonine protein kinase, CMGC group [Chaenotheca gracillima]|nr:MAG: serine/threonine protein kinase, CMGC group [Chaenotheca gracillima]
MDRRTHETPMDFEWQSSGPADHTSPFHQLSVNYRQTHEDDPQKKRSFSIFDSPIKPSRPNSSATPGGKPMPSFRDASFTTPRKFDLDMCSSGAENPSSPENADAEDTPDAPSRTMTKFSANDNSNKNDKKGSIFGRFGSPGRGELRRGVFSDNITHRVRKRRRREADRENRQLARRGSQDDDSSYDDQDSQRPKDRKDHNIVPPSIGTIPALFGWLESHPHLPHILSYYAQLLLNVFAVLFIIYLVYVVVSTIRSDVDMASDEAMADILAEMAACAQQFVENKCDRSNRVPALEKVCTNWEKCMNRDPASVGRARVSAHTFAEILNSFIEPISYKALVFILTIIFGCVAISNAAFVFFRSKANPSPSAPQAPPPPPTPQHHYPATPHHGYTGYMSQYPYQGQSQHWMQSDKRQQPPPYWDNPYGQGFPPLPPPTPSEGRALSSPSRRNGSDR